MSNNIEEKLNKVLEKVNQIDEMVLKVDGLSLKVNKIEKTMNSGFESLENKFENADEKLEGYIKFSSERMTNMEDSLEKSKNEILSEIQKTRLDSMDRYANKEKVFEHETRITKLEEKVF